MLAVLLLLPAYWLLIFVATHLPPQNLPHIHAGLNSDKLQHFVAYAGLAFLLTTAWRLKREFRWRELLGVLLVVTVYGALDEVTQAYVGRTMDIRDWIADCLGATTGIVAALSVYEVARRVIGK